MTDRKRKDCSGAFLPMVLRMFWFGFGPAAIGLAAVMILQNEKKGTAPYDLLLWAAVLSVILVRFLDIRFCDGSTAEGKPATMRHWLRHAVTLALVSFGIWIAVHALGRVVG